MDVDAKFYTAVQLRNWCLALGLPSSGTKAAMVLRLNEIDAEQRGDPPENLEVSKQNVDNERNDQEVATNDGSCVPNSEFGRDAEDIEAELNFLKLDREMLLRENKLLKEKFEKHVAANTEHVNVAANTEHVNVAANTEHGNVTANTENVGVAAMTKHVANTSAGHSISLNIIKDMIPEYDGAHHFEFWEAQVRNLMKGYQVDENTMRALITVKFSGKALKWLHSNLPCATCNFDELRGSFR